MSEHLKKRNFCILCTVLFGLTLKATGESYNLSGPRVRQIVWREVRRFNPAYNSASLKELRKYKFFVLLGGHHEEKEFQCIQTIKTSVK